MRRIAEAWVDGFRRVLHVPAVVIGVLVVTVLAAMPLTLAMRDALQAELGRSMAAADLAEGFHLEHWQELQVRLDGVGNAFQPQLMGFATTLDNVSDFLDADMPMAPVALAVAVYLGVWIFLTGGILDRYARQRPTRSIGFFSACGVFFFRFLRLAMIAGAAYWWLFTSLHGWLFDGWMDRITADLAVERTEFYWRTLMYVIFAAALALVNVWVDYAKIRAVVEDRRSIIGALVAAFGFIVRHPGQVLGLYALNTLTFLVVIAMWAAVAPEAGGLGASMWWGLMAGQVYVLVRLVLKLQFLASQTALFQAALAHAAYTAVPAPEWPESPAAELIPHA